MRANDRIGMSSNFGGDEPGYQLRPQVENQCRLTANLKGNHLDMIEQVARTAYAADKGGARTEAERRLECLRQMKQRCLERYREAWSRLRHTEPRIRKNTSRKIGLRGWIKILTSVGVLALFIWLENGAAAQ